MASEGCTKAANSTALTRRGSTYESAGTKKSKYSVNTKPFAAAEAGPCGTRSRCL